MRKLRLATMALALVAVGALAATTAAQADLAVSHTKIPNLRAFSGSAVQTVDWVIYVKYYNGCQRQRWCRSRYWNGYKYVYSGCYWGACYGGGGGGYGGYSGGGGY